MSGAIRTTSSALVARAIERLPDAWGEGEPRRGAYGDGETADLGWALLGDDPEAVVDALLGAMAQGATAEQLGRGVAYAAALRVVRFHTQNDHADWNTVHHAFTAANALHQALARNTTPELLRGLVHGALRVYLDRFLNVPAARLPSRSSAALDELDTCWEVQGAVNDAGEIVYGYLRGGGDSDALVAALGSALLREDVEFHWYQVFEAGVRQFACLARRTPRKVRSFSPGSRASWPPIRRHGVSSHASSRSQPGSAAGRTCIRRRSGAE